MDELKDARYYWVLFGGRWRIAEWYDGYWWITGSEVPKEKSAIDDYEGPLTRGGYDG